MIATLFFLQILTGPYEAILDTLATGALTGVIAGIVIGAVILPLMQTPDALGRALLIGLFFGLGMAAYQLIQVGAVTGGTLGSILNSFDGPTGRVVGQMILQGIIYTLYAIMAGAALAVLITTPDKALRGAIVGALVGAFLGALLYGFLDFIDWRLAPVYMQLVTGVLVWGVLTAVFGK